MSDEVCIADKRHTPWLISKDDLVDKNWIERCIELGEYLIATRNLEPVGFMRWSWFWGKVPYIDMIRVERCCRGTGLGSLLLGRLEEIAISRGVDIVMTSCEKDEQEPLAWYLKQGFEKTGEIEMPTIQTACEVFLIKRLR